MRLFEFALTDKHKHGTIAMLKPCREDADRLHQWCNENNVPCIDKDKLHCTVLFSKAPVEHLTKHHDKDIVIKANITGWKKLGEALTLELDAPTVHKMHEYMIEQGGTHDFPEFIAHTSVCYKWPQQETPAALPNFPIKFNKLYVMEIDPNFGS